MSMTAFGRRHGVSVEEGKEGYRACWAQFCFTRDKATKHALMDAMDHFQTCIATRPGEGFEEFADTLPGYREHWKRPIVTHPK